MSLLTLVIAVKKLYQEKEQSRIGNSVYLRSQKLEKIQSIITSSPDPIIESTLAEQIFKLSEDEVVRESHSLKNLVSILKLCASNCLNATDSRYISATAQLESDINLLMADNKKEFGHLYSYELYVLMLQEFIQHRLEIEKLKSENKIQAEALQTASDIRTELKDEIIRLSAGLKSLASTSRDLETENAAIKKKLIAAETELAQRTEFATAEIFRLNAELQQTADAMKELETELEIIGANITLTNDTLLNTINEHNQRITLDTEAHEAELEKLNSENAALMETLKRNFRSLQAKHKQTDDKLNSEIVYLKAQIVALGSEFSDATQANTQLNAQKDLADGHIRSLQIENNALVSKTQTQDQALVAMEEKDNVNHAEIARLSQTLTALSAEMAERIESLSTHIVFLNSDLDGAKKKLTTAKQEHAELKKQMDKTKSESRDTLNSQEENYHNARKKWQQKSNADESKAATAKLLLESDIKKLTAEVTRLTTINTASREESQTTIAQLRTDADKSKADNTRLRKQVKDLENDAMQNKEVHTELQDSLSNTTSSLSRMEQSVKSLQVSFQVITDERDAQQTRYQQQQVVLAAQLDELAELRKEQELLKADRANLSEQLSRLHKKAEEKSPTHSSRLFSNTAAVSATPKSSQTKVTVTGSPKPASMGMGMNSGK